MEIEEVKPFYANTTLVTFLVFELIVEINITLKTKLLKTAVSRNTRSRG